MTNQSDETPPRSYCLRFPNTVALSTVSRAAGSSRTIAITHAAIAACRVGDLRDAGDGIWPVRYEIGRFRSTGSVVFGDLQEVARRVDEMWVVESAIGRAQVDWICRVGGLQRPPGGGDEV